MDLSDVIVTALGRLRGAMGYKAVDRFSVDSADVPAAEREQTDMHRFFYENKGPIVHKWRHYLDVYDRHLSRYRNSPFRLLEIGVSRGGSLSLWRRYFGPRATIFGIDIDPRCARFDGRDGEVRIGSQADADFLEGVVKEMGGIDVVIDDGSHVARHQYASFRSLFHLLSSDGVYICEDLCTSYWRGRFEGGYRRQSTFIEVAKRLVDDMHADFHRHGENVPGASRSIGGLHFYKGIVVIEKAPQPLPTHVEVGVADL